MKFLVQQEDFLEDRLRLLNRRRRFPRLFDHHHGSGDEIGILRTEEGHAVPTVGSTIHVTPRADRIHYFDAVSGKRKQAA